MDPIQHGGRPKDLAHTHEHNTDSLDLAAWLVCQGFRMQRLDPPAPTSPRPLTRFVFDHTEELADAVAMWDSGQPLSDTDLRRYINVKRDLYRRARSVATLELGGNHAS